jgi:DNA-binding CsgD family transcriptional regulator
LHQLLMPFLSELGNLPGPQREALRVTFSMAGGRSPEPFLVCLSALTLFAHVAAERPLLVIVDDAQWLDQESAEALGFVARRLDVDRVAIMFSVREPSARRLPLEGVPELELTGLPEREARQLLTAVTASDVADHVSAQIAESVRGNPLALLELSAELSEAELAGRAALPDPLPLGDRIEARFLSQVRQLPPETQSLLLLAACDRYRDASLFWRAAARLGLDPEASVPAEERRLIAFKPEPAFRHPLIRSAVYHGAPLVERRRVHKALAAVIGPRTDPDRRVWHLAAAAPAPNETIAAELEALAERSGARGGYVARVDFLERAAALTPDRARRAERQLAAAVAALSAAQAIRAQGLLDEARPHLEGDLLQAEGLELHGRILAAQYRSLPEALAALIQAAHAFAPLDVARARNSLLLALDAALLMPPAARTEVARAARDIPLPEGVEPTVVDLLVDGWAADASGDYGTAAVLLRKALMLLRASNEVEHVQPAWFAAVSLADDEGLLALAARWVRIARDRGQPAPLRLALTMLGTYQFYAGRFEESEASAEEVESVSVATGNPRGSAGSSTTVWVLAKLGREAEARTAAAAAREFALATGMSADGVALDALVPLELGLRNYAAARDGARASLADDNPFTALVTSAYLVEAAVRTGEREIAHDAFVRLSARAEASGSRVAMGLLARGQALLADDDQAEASYLHSLELLQGTREPELAWSRLLYGEWLRGHKRHRDARMQLRQAFDSFDRMGMRAFAERARHELEATGERVSRQGEASRDGLSFREAQIAALVADGARNAEVAAHLFISPSTVDYHLRKVFRKLGVTSRTQLARHYLQVHNRASG